MKNTHTKHTVSGLASPTIACSLRQLVVGWAYRVLRTSANVSRSALLVCAGVWLFPVEGHAAGNLVAWGDNSFGQTSAPPGLIDAIAVSAGDGFNVELRVDGTVFAWGRNDAGQSTVPSNLGRAIAISAGETHALAARSNGTVVAWGANDYGKVNVPCG